MKNLNLKFVIRFSLLYCHFIGNYIAVSSWPNASANYRFFQTKIIFNSL